MTGGSITSIDGDDQPQLEKRKKKNTLPTSMPNDNFSSHQLIIEENVDYGAVREPNMSVKSDVVTGFTYEGSQTEF